MIYIRTAIDCIFAAAFSGLFVWLGWWPDFQMGFITLIAIYALIEAYRK